MKRSDNFSDESIIEEDTHSEIYNQGTVTEPKIDYGPTDEKTESIGSYEYYTNDSTEDMVHSS